MFDDRLSLLDCNTPIGQKLLRILYIPRTSAMSDPKKELKKHLLNESKEG